MIKLSDLRSLDLGQDRERVTPEDAERQHATVDHILEAFFCPGHKRREIQLLADEVGLGKTFVALAVGHVVLTVARRQLQGDIFDELAGSYKAVVVVTPAGNHALCDKWHREVEALRTRCSLNNEATQWFTSKVCHNIDDLLRSIQQASDLRRKTAPVVLIAEAGIFTKRLSDVTVRFFTACLFRWWRNKLQMRDRYHVIRGLSHTNGSSAWSDSAAWVNRGEYDIELWNWTRHEAFLNASDRERDEWDSGAERKLFESISVDYETVEEALRKLERHEGSSILENLLQFCRNAPQREPGDRRTSQYTEYVQQFSQLKNGLRDVYKRLWPYLIQKSLPLVIADEAHHWRHSARQDCKSFCTYVARFAKRLLLLTATPFQLHRDELMAVLGISDSMERAIGHDAVKALSAMRERLSASMQKSEEAGRAFSKEWGALNEQLGKVDDRLAAVSSTAPFALELSTKTIDEYWKKVKPGDGAKEALNSVPGALRPFFRTALELCLANRHLERIMKPLVIRHRRGTGHRRYWIGREYPPPQPFNYRPDQSQLHLSPGQVMPPRAELAQYVLMKVVAELGSGTKRTALGMDLTGCYTTLWKSKEGAKALAKSSSGKDSPIVNVLKKMTGEGTSPNLQDARHPKVQTVVEEVLKRWERGEKSLIFCFRVPTAKTLCRLLEDEVGQRQAEAKRVLFVTRSKGKEKETDKAMQQFRRALTSREGSGVPLFVDRVLFGWFSIHNLQIPRLEEADVRRVAQLCSRAKHSNVLAFRDPTRLDRVFLHRAIEHSLAIRLSQDLNTLGSIPEALHLPTQALLRLMSSEDWVKYRYGQSSLTSSAQTTEPDSEQRAESLAKSSLGARYELEEKPDKNIANALTTGLITQFRKGKNTLLESLTSGPNLFVPLGDCIETIGALPREHAKELARLEFEATFPQQRVAGHKVPDITIKQLVVARQYNDERRLDSLIRSWVGKSAVDWNWLERAKIHDAVVRAFLREDLLFRMPESVFQGNDETWRESLLRGFHETSPKAPQMEPLSHRVKEFVRELIEMGPDEREAHLRYAMNPQAQSVALVTGEDKVDRDAIFSGFNTPLLPDILICTAVGQEGIDLHRQCSHVIHYDLGWNPATIEQRTGRTDRIGSKAFRERKLAETLASNNAAPESSLPGLEIALPYLAGTYDERMFDCLRMRAQVFDVLTGGDPTLDRSLDSVWLDADDAGEANTHEFIALPHSMLADLRVNLSVAQ